MLLSPVMDEELTVEIKQFKNIVKVRLIASLLFLSFFIFLLSFFLSFCLPAGLSFCHDFSFVCLSLFLPACRLTCLSFFPLEMLETLFQDDRVVNHFTYCLKIQASACTVYCKGRYSHEFFISGFSFRPIYSQGHNLARSSNED